MNDGTNDYIYGLGRIAQVNTDAAYFLGDALGSVRQLADESGIVTLAQSYMPYGDILSSAGIAASSYGFTGEWTDASGLVYLRARYYHPEMGRFLTQDPWEGDYNSPMSYNPWVYGYGNPVNLTDTSGQKPGFSPCSPMIGADQDACEKIIRGISPYSSITREELLLLDFETAECSPLKTIMDSTGLFVRPPYTSNEYSYWYHWLLEFVPGWWNNQGKNYVSIGSVVRYAIGQEMGAKLDKEPLANAMTEAFARKAWDRQFGFYKTIGGRQSVQMRVDQGVFDMTQCTTLENGKKSCPFDLNGDRFATLMNNDRYLLENNAILGRYGIKILYNANWRSGLQNDRPYDWANLQGDNPQWLKDWIWHNAPTYDSLNCKNIDSEGYCADPHGVWYTPQHKPPDPFVDYVLTLRQGYLLCGNLSCVDLKYGAPKPDFVP